LTYAREVYGHFDDREATVAAVIDSAFTDFVDALRAVVDVDDPVERLRRLGRAYLAFAAERPPLPPTVRPPRRGALRSPARRRAPRLTENQPTADVARVRTPPRLLHSNCHAE